MRITAEISYYPLHESFVADIKGFIADLRQQADLEVVTNRMSTQIRGEFDAVTGAIARCMRPSLAEPGMRVFVVKYLNADLDISARREV